MENDMCQMDRLSKEVGAEAGWTGDHSDPWKMDILSALHTARKTKLIRRKHGSDRKRVIRDRLAGEQNWRCCYCGGIMTYGVKGVVDDALATLDHIISKHKNGTDDVYNQVVACRKCNSDKREISPVVYLGRFDRKCAEELRDWLLTDAPPDMFVKPHRRNLS